MKIRQAYHTDLVQILPVYAHARQVMRETGNPTQWGEDRPTRETLEQDIRAGQLYVIEQEDRIVGAFAFIIGEDPTYRKIDGAWKNDMPYGTIHRLASGGQAKGILKSCIGFCREQIANLRIDTHENNRIMQRLLEQTGFARCGIIYVEDGSPRLAYQYTEDGGQQ